MNSIKDSIKDSNTIVIDSVQLREAKQNDTRPILEREPILKTVDINTQSGSVNKTELQIGDSDNKSIGIVTAYLKNKLVEISDDQITIKDGTDNSAVLFTIKVNADKDLSVNDAFIIASSGKVKKMLIDNSMIYNTANTGNYVDGQLLFIEDVSATTSGS